MLRVAIDGPGGTGKSTIAKAVAGKFGIEYIDTGAMYRSIALKSVREGIFPDDESSVNDMLASTEIDFREGRIWLDGENVEGLIRTNEISMAASNISKLACVRSKVDELSRRLAASKDVVMEGRDIGTAVIPDAEVKIFMTADPLVRAKRRYGQLIEQGKEADLDKIAEEKQRLDDAVFLDTSDMTIEENIEAVAEIIRKAL